MLKRENQDLINFINKWQEESTRTIPNLLQRPEERIPAAQPIAVTVTELSPPHKAIWLWFLSTGQCSLFERLANVSGQDRSSSKQLWADWECGVRTIITDLGVHRTWDKSKPITQEKPTQIQANLQYPKELKAQHLL